MNRSLPLLAVLSLAAAAPCGAQVRAAAVTGVARAPGAFMDRSSGIMTDFFKSPTPNVDSVVGVVHLADKLSAPELAPLAPAIRAGAVGVIGSPAPMEGIPSTVGPKLAVLLQPSVFNLLTENQKTEIKELGKAREALVAPERHRIRRIFDGIYARLEWASDMEPSALYVHDADGSFSYRVNPGFKKKP